MTAFFSISGMLIYRSMAGRKSVSDYIVSRVLRIFPGLWAMLIISALILGIFFSTIQFRTWVADPSVYRYLAGNAILYVPQYHLPGVFEANPIPNVINGSLWTLRFEFTCYIAVLILFLLRAYRNERNFLIMCSAFVITYSGYLILTIFNGDLDALLYDGSDLAKLHRLSLAFFLGMLMGRYLDKFRPSAWMAALSAAAAWLLFGSPLFLTALTISIAIIVFWLAFLPWACLKPLRRMHDYSYGIYIYAFPVQQSVAEIAPSWSPFANAITSYAVTLPLAALSWYFVEKPALNMKTRFLKRGIRESTSK